MKRSAMKCIVRLPWAPEKTHECLSNEIWRSPDPFRAAHSKVLFSLFPIPQFRRLALWSPLAKVTFGLPFQTYDFHIVDKVGFDLVVLMLKGENSWLPWMTCRLKISQTGLHVMLPKNRTNWMNMSRKACHDELMSKDGLWEGILKTKGSNVVWLEDVDRRVWVVKRRRKVDVKTGCFCHGLRNVGCVRNVGMRIPTKDVVLFETGGYVDLNIDSKRLALSHWIEIALFHFLHVFLGRVLFTNSIPFICTFVQKNCFSRWYSTKSFAVSSVYHGIESLEDSSVLYLLNLHDGRFRSSEGNRYNRFFK